MDTLVADRDLGILPMPPPLPAAHTMPLPASIEVADPFEAAKRISRWHALPQPNFKPWSVRISLAGAVIAVPAVAALIVQSMSSTWHLISFSLYAVGLLSMLIVSAVYHACEGPESKVKALRKLDYGAISIMIAGNFTPFCLIGLPTSMGLSVLAAVWAIGAYAVYLIATHDELPIWGLITLYMAMGWMGLFVIFPVALAIGWKGASLVFAGGIVYTVGTLVFNGDETKYKQSLFGRHEIWHGLILVAVTLHYAAFRLYMLP